MSGKVFGKLVKFARSVFGKKVVETVPTTSAENSTIADVFKDIGGKYADRLNAASTGSTSGCKELGCWDKATSTITPKLVAVDAKPSEIFPMRITPTRSKIRI